MKKVISLLLALAVMAMGVAAFAATPVAATDLAYKGELVLMHFSTSEESEGNGGSDGFRTTIAAWKEAHPYDGGLKTYYQNKYNLKTAVQLDASVKDTDFVAAHYGDWPAPEEFIFN
jgi:ABC-type glycerol-3-phosphate transport system substrate-binding protein